MKKQNTKKVGTKPQMHRGSEVLTYEKFVPMFENMKDLIKSTAKGTERVLGKRIDSVERELKTVKTDVKQLQVAVLENAKAIKDTKTELKEEMHGMEERLGSKIDRNAIRLDNHETRITTLEETR